MNRKSVHLAVIASVFTLLTGIIGAVIPASASATPHNNPIVGRSAATPNDSFADCYVISAVDDLLVHTQPDANSPALAQINSGTELDSPGCDILVTGGAYSDCGSDANLWDKVNYNGIIEWVADECVEVN